MPNRIIREGINDSDSVDLLSYSAEVFYRRIMSMVDDFGRGDGRLDTIRAELYPLRLDDTKENFVTLTDIEAWMNSCIESGLMKWYKINGKPYVEIINFNQSLRTMRSKYPNEDGNYETKDEYLQRISSARKYNHLLLESKGNEIEYESNVNEEKLSQREMFLQDLPNSKLLIEIAKGLSIKDENTLKPWIDLFKSSGKMRLQYKNFLDFGEHFKNWYNLQDKSPKNNGYKGPKKKGE